MLDSQHKIVQYCWESWLYLIRYDIPFLPRALLLLCQGIDRTFSPQGAGRTSLFLAELSFTKALVGYSFSSALPNAWIYRYLRLDIFVAWQIGHRELERIFRRNVLQGLVAHQSAFVCSPLLSSAHLCSPALLAVLVSLAVRCVGGRWCVVVVVVSIVSGMLA